MKVKNIENLEVFYTLGNKYILDRSKKFNGDIKSKRRSKEFYQDINNFIYDTVCWYQVKFLDNYLEFDDNLLKLQECSYTNNYDHMTIDRFNNNLSTTITYILNSNLEDIKKDDYRKKIGIIRKYISDMIILNLLYSNNTKPEYGYFRAKKFIDDFNCEYNFSMDYSLLDEFMDKDYSYTNPIYIDIINNQEKEEKNVKKRLFKRRKNKRK